MEFLNRCSSPTVDVNYKFYYPYGNTLMEDFLEDFLLDDDTNILLLGSGDIRHILKTVGGFFLRSKAGIAPPKFVKFEVTDVDAPIVARNIILLKIIMGMNPVKQEDVDFLWDVWYNKSLLSKHHERLQNVITVLLEEISEASGGNQDLWHLGNSESRTQVETALRAWKFRPQFHEIEYGHRSQLIQSPLLCKDRTEYLTDLNYIEDDGTFLLAKTARDPSSRKRESEVKNPTMFRPYENMFCVPLDVQPWLSYFPLESKTEFSSLYSVATMKLRETIKIFLSALNKTKISITFWTEEALRFCYLTLEPQGQTFQLIHTSNLSDYLGLINVLLACQPLLKTENSVLMLETCRWSLQYPTVEMYLRENVCCDALLLPTLFGLRLAEDFQLGTTSLHTVPNLYKLKDSVVQKTRWVKVSTNQYTVPIDLSASSDVRRVLRNIIKLTMSSDGIEELHTKDSKHSYTPLTLFRVLRHLQHRITGGMPVLLEFVKKTLTDGTYGRYQHSLMWEMLSNILADNDKEAELTEIKIAFPDLGSKLKEIETNETGPDEMIFPARLVLKIAENHLSEVVSIFTYNRKEQSFSFPMLRTQWNTLSDRDQIYAVIIGMRTGETRSNQLSLKKAAKLGLWQSLVLQKKCTLESSWVERGISCVEYTDHYELRVITDSKGEKLNLTVKFLPEDKIGKAELVLGLTYSSCCKEHRLSFSCYLEKSKSKFTLNSSQCKVTAILAKQGNLNSGRSVMPLRNFCEKHDFKNISLSALESYIEESKLLETMFSSSVDFQLQAVSTVFDEYIQEPFSHLRRIVESILKTTTDSRNHFDILSSDDPRIDDHGLHQEPRAIIAVTNAFTYKGLPLLKIKVIENETAMGLIGTDQLTWNTWANARNSTLTREQLSTGTYPKMIIRTTHKGYDIFLKMLRINSKRINKKAACDSESVWLYNSYIQAIFPVDKLPHYEELIPILMSNPELLTGCPRYTRQYCEDMLKLAFPLLYKNIEDSVKNLGNFTGAPPNLQNTPEFMLGQRIGFELMQLFSRGMPSDFPFPPAFLNQCFTSQGGNQPFVARENCHNLKCTRLNVRDQELMKCVKCRNASYCSKSCQREDWPNHKKTCKPLEDQGKSNLNDHQEASSKDPASRQQEKRKETPASKLAKPCDTKSNSEKERLTAIKSEANANPENFKKLNSQTQKEVYRNNNSNNVKPDPTNFADDTRLKKISDSSCGKYVDQNVIASISDLGLHTEDKASSCSKTVTAVTGLEPAKTGSKSSVGLTGLKQGIGELKLDKAAIIPIVSKSKPGSTESKPGTSGAKPVPTESKPNTSGAKLETTYPKLNTSGSKSVSTESKQTITDSVPEAKEGVVHPMSCRRCGRLSEVMKCCSQCRSAYYCSLGCQHSDWSQHRAHCRVPDTFDVNVGM